MLLISIIWIGLSRRQGIKLFYILMFSSLVNTMLKNVFQEPRPFLLDPTLGVIQVGGYGFPSGAAQSAVLLPGILLSCQRNKWSWLISANYFFWISLSRVYLGVHFPSDLLGGWLIGLALLLIYLYAFPTAERILDKCAMWISLAASILMPLILTYFFNSPTAIKLAGAAIGAGIGIFIFTWKKLYLDDPNNNIEMISRMVWGASGTFAVYALAGLFPLQNRGAGTAFPFFCFGLWLGLGAPALWHMIVKLLPLKHNGEKC